MRPIFFSFMLFFMPLVAAEAEAQKATDVNSDEVIQVPVIKAKLPFYENIEQMRPHVGFLERERLKYILNILSYFLRNENGEALDQFGQPVAKSGGSPVELTLTNSEADFYADWLNNEGNLSPKEIDFLKKTSKGVYKKHKVVLNQLASRLFYQDPLRFKGPPSIDLLKSNKIPFQKASHLSSLFKCYGLDDTKLMEEPAVNFGLSLYYQKLSGKALGVAYPEAICIVKYANYLTFPVSYSASKMRASIEAAFSKSDYKAVSYALNLNRGHWVTLVIQQDGKAAVVDSLGRGSPRSLGVLVDNLNKEDILDREHKKITFELFNDSTTLKKGVKGGLSTGLQADGHSCGVHSVVNALAAAAFGGIHGIEIIVELIKNGNVHNLSSLFEFLENKESAEKARAEPPKADIKNANNFMKQIREDLKEEIRKKNRG